MMRPELLEIRNRAMQEMKHRGAQLSEIAGIFHLSKDHVGSVIRSLDYRDEMKRRRDERMASKEG